MKFLKSGLEALDEVTVIALGSNMAGGYPSSEALLEAALARFPGARLPVLARSGWWRSAAWPDPGEPEYRNGVALVETSLRPRAVLEALFSIERGFGRTRGAANAPRTLDLDLIACGREVIDAPGLVLPHPRAHERLFVMGPLAEIAPGWVHPTLGRSAAELVVTATVGADAIPI
ncbi:MAG TPA: 2-amino-4-hydroxy-6-hydroxymethyldihydropteridine diphosphokinase [Phenylobacterium sp.]|uniref:2-amino-4-hydroxy-6- hydroxymethyldihydropteridine diphosphokinase n=1 Tax=Phenylobacterium sp. TaxID=1871053 RepID=UPI002C2A6EE1|nr:2-amino-4-hydroxy-6-hydroxymethyldihydropteridine diphosphokinase [Phenylobacterium sp.]HSV02392.1 2-amino-4-hydroxy-6-hydroxymethyldihydropteridine diphosphokinase [Phenylobacterium sp.]